MQEWAQRIRAARIHRGMSQTQVSKAIGVPQPRVSEWERGKHKPQKHSFLSLEKALEVPWYWLRDGLLIEPSAIRQEFNVYEIEAEKVKELTGDAAAVAASKIRSRR